MVATHCGQKQGLPSMLECPSVPMLDASGGAATRIGGRERLAEKGGGPTCA